jgi:hypothetical protein
MGHEQFLAQYYIFIHIVKKSVTMHTVHVYLYLVITIKLTDYCNKYSIDPDYIINSKPDAVLMAYLDFLNDRKLSYSNIVLQATMFFQRKSSTGLMK